LAFYRVKERMPKRKAVDAMTGEGESVLLIEEKATKKAEKVKKAEDKLKIARGEIEKDREELREEWRKISAERELNKKIKKEAETEIVKWKNIGAKEFMAWQGNAWALKVKLEEKEAERLRGPRFYYGLPRFYEDDAPSGN